MKPSNIQSYALFVNNEFVTIFYYPSEGGEQFISMTAALKSNPRVVLDNSNSVQSVNKYSVFVDNDYAGYLFIIKEDPRYNLDSLHWALQNNPVFVWIESDAPVHPSTRWSYNNNVLRLIEE